MKKLTTFLIITLLVLAGCVSEQKKQEASTTDINRYGEFTILEGFHGFPGDRTNILTLEEAASIGASYVFDVFEDYLSGRYMELTFNYNPHISHSSWIGNIGDSPSEFEGEEEGFRSAQITFMIDAISGERINITNHALELELSLEELLESSIELNDAQIEVATEIATDYAKRHFNQGTVESVEPGTYSGGIADFMQGMSLNFVAIDTIDSGERVVEIRLHQETLQLLDIRTPLEILAPYFE